MELEECIKDAADASMQEYSNSEAYLSRRAVLDANITSFISGIDKEQCDSLNHILDQISTEYGLYAAEAYKNGVVEGIASYDKVLQWQFYITEKDRPTFPWAGLSYCTKTAG